MIYMLCPTCGSLLRRKQPVYEDRMEEVCEEIGVDYEMVSSGLLDGNKEFLDKRAKVINDLCEKQCCKVYLMTYVKVGKLIKSGK
jgi:DNA-directed RNA polymerase subunit N (RpoN/RPB10)